MTATYSTIPDDVPLEAPQESKPKASRKVLLAAVLLLAAGAAAAATAVKSQSTMTKFDDIECEKDEWCGQIDVQVTNACGKEPPKELTARITRFVGGPYPVCAGEQDPRLAVAIYDKERGNPEGLVSIHSKSRPWNIASNWSSANKQCFEVELAGPKDQERVFRPASTNVLVYRGEKTVVTFVDKTDC